MKFVALVVTVSLAVSVLIIPQREDLVSVADALCGTDQGLLDIITMLL